MNTLIRIDVAHLMHLASRWKSIRNERHPAIKNTRLYCVALMVDAKSVDTFARIFLLTSIISLHSYLYTSINVNGTPLTIADALSELQNAISSREKVIKSFEESMTSYEASKGDQISDFEEAGSGTLTHQFIIKLIYEARSTMSLDVNGKEINAFYREDFVKDLEWLGKEFPLWTGIMCPKDDRNASSAHQEGYFAYLRNTIFEFVLLPCSADRFVKEHIESKKSGTNLLAAKL